MTSDERRKTNDEWAASEGEKGSELTIDSAVASPLEVWSWELSTYAKATARFVSQSRAKKLVVGHGGFVRMANSESQ